MNKYHLAKVEKPDEPLSENEMRITNIGNTSRYIGYAARTLNENKSHLRIKAIGQTISKAVTVAEILKHRIPGLYQITELKSLQRVKHYEPVEEGLDEVVVTDFVSCLVITLSFKPLDTNHSGYQPPIPSELVSPLSDDGLYRGRGRGGARRGRGGRGGRSNRGQGRRRNSSKRDVDVQKSSDFKDSSRSRPQQKPRDNNKNEHDRPATRGNRVVSRQGGIRLRTSRKGSNTDPKTKSQAK